MEKTEEIQMFSEALTKVKQEITKDIVGQNDVVENTLIAVIAGGNVLLEGVPGVGKTRLVRSLGQALSLPFSRIQFTPDLMPYDVTGSTIVEKGEDGKFKNSFQKGPIFANLVLADEINRATPKTQSAMLEAMQEHKVTVSNVSYKLEEPFFVLATENPIEQDGTYPLPEAQMDRFMFKLFMTFPKMDEVKDIIKMTQITQDETAVSVLDGETILKMRQLSKEVPVADEVLTYAASIVSATHIDQPEACDCTKKYIKYGASPRAGQALITGAKVRALMYGRYNVSYEDVDALAHPVLRHRIKATYEAIDDNLSIDEIIDMLLAETKRKVRI